MATSLRAASFVCVTLLFVGCGTSTQPTGQSGDDPHDANAQVVTQSTAPALNWSLPASTRPDQVVEAFLKALRDGDDDVAAALLTTKAREETARHDLVVEPPGTPNAEFFVGEIEYVDAKQTGAHVKSVWSEAAGGSDVSYEIVWALRQQADGWRIAGMATEIISGQRPVFLNFEDPSDMLEKWQHAEEIAARHQESTHRDSTISR